MCEIFFAFRFASVVAFCDFSFSDFLFFFSVSDFHSVIPFPFSFFVSTYFLDRAIFFVVCFSIWYSRSVFLFFL